MVMHPGQHRDLFSCNPNPSVCLILAFLVSAGTIISHLVLYGDGGVRRVGEYGELGEPAPSRTIHSPCTIGSVSTGDRAGDGSLMISKLRDLLPK